MLSCCENAPTVVLVSAASDAPPQHDYFFTFLDLVMGSGDPVLCGYFSTISFFAKPRAYQEKCMFKRCN